MAFWNGYWSLCELDSLFLIAVVETLRRRYQYMGIQSSATPNALSNSYNLGTHFHFGPCPQSLWVLLSYEHRDNAVGERRALNRLKRQLCDVREVGGPPMLEQWKDITHENPFYIWMPE